MPNLTPDGLRAVTDIAQRHGVSVEAALALIGALVAGGGRQAQFSHPDLGGMGQWSQGGMIMVGDMFNSGLKYRVDALCNDLAALIHNQPSVLASAAPSQAQSQGGGVSLFAAGASSGNWWPGDLGQPGSAGAQNDMRYAFFPAARRLAIREGGRVSVYDTGEHALSGFSQQQGGDRSLTFTSQSGLVRVADLPLVSPAAEPKRNAPAETPATPAAAARPAQSPPPPSAVAAPPPEEAVRAAPSAYPAPAPSRASPAAPQSMDEILKTIERLGELREKGILTDEEFSAKKAELLGRL